LNGDDLARAERLVTARRRLARGETLFAAGGKFNVFYAVQHGSLKASVFDAGGREQVIGLFLGGNLIGLEGIARGAYGSTASALEDSVVCILPYGAVERMERDLPPMQRRLHALLAHQIERDQRLAALLGATRADKRLARFLVDLSQRFARRGHSSRELKLRMGREDIASYLCLSSETVSRALSQLQKDGVIAVQRRHVVILDMPRLLKLQDRAD
jgi:CRP/FNR family transcriptional regulator